MYEQTGSKCLTDLINAQTFQLITVKLLTKYDIFLLIYYLRKCDKKC